MVLFDFKGIVGLTIGLLLGYVLAITFTKENTNIVEYVSQDEVLEFERKRLKRIEDHAQKQLFFGRPKIAAELIEENALARQRENAQIVFSSGKVYGKNVVSISRDIYDEVIDKLKEGADSTSDDNDQ